ncbi:hypothetical protein BJ170DRAFT_259307 [Xylariales sp. AK1849]|nr:hypothetical protein BJ170DRAFT_259307 [Xylariales sp. AK1849]
MSSSPHAHYFANAAFAVGLIPALLGINAILRPVSALSILRFSSPPQPEAQRLTRSLIQMYGARDLTIGLTTLAVWSTGDRRALGFIMLASIPLAVVDGLVSRWQVGGGEWAHWGVIPVGLVLGAGLLGWV